MSEPQKPITLTAKFTESLLAVFKAHDVNEKRWEDYFAWKLDVDTFMRGSKEREDKFFANVKDIKDLVAAEYKDREKDRKRIHRLLSGFGGIGVLYELFEKGYRFFTTGSIF